MKRRSRWNGEADKDAALGNPAALGGEVMSSACGALPLPPASD